MAQPDWSELLPELLVEIGNSVAIYEDLLSFRGVCSSWRSAARNIKVESDFTLPGRFPALMLPPETEDSGSGSGLREFFLLSPDPDTNTNAIRTVYLPEASRKRCLSSKGWLFTMESNDCYPTLVHPYTRQQIRLPKLDTFPYCNTNEVIDYHFVRKFALSSSDPVPDDHSSSVMVMWGGKGRLGFCKPGDASWTAVNYPDEECNVGPILDFTYHNKKVYAVDGAPRLLVCDLHGPNPTKLMKISVCPRKVIPHVDSIYIMPSGLDDDRLWIVSRHGMWDNFDELDETDEIDNLIPPGMVCKTNYFQVLDFNLKEGGRRWVELDDFEGKRALFVGYNASFSIRADPGTIIKPDCIYFTDDVFLIYMHYPDKRGGGRDMGIYDYIEGTIEPYFTHRESLSLLTPPLWVYDETNCC